MSLLTIALGILTIQANSWIPIVRATDKPPAPSAKELEALVHQLGDNNFSVREQAAKRLIALGRAARPALEAGLKDVDLEVRRRCEQLLPLALKQDLENRLAGFLADPDGKQKHDLPGWQLYQKLVGQAPAARRFYADIFRVDADLLETATTLPRKAVDQFTNRCQRLQEMSGNPNAISSAVLANLLLVASNPEVVIPTPGIDQLCFLLVQHLPRLLTEDPAGELVKKMVVQWMKQRSQGGHVGSMLTVARKLHLKEGTELALIALRNKGESDNIRAEAAMVIGCAGGREHLAVLEAMLNETGQIGSFSTGNVSGTTQVGDVALAMLIRLTDQKLADYHYPAANLTEEVIQIHGGAILGFPDDAAREAAKKKWKNRPVK
jgi:hypothetical protein